MNARRPTMVLAVAGGKGGVGKTSVTVNVAIALQRRGFRTGILDADFGLGNVDVLLGLSPVAHLGHLLAGEKTLAEIITTGPCGVQIVPASSGLRTLTSLNANQRTRLSQAIEQIRGELDFLLIDTASGISDNVIDTIRLADRVIVVTSLEPSAVVDAYATAKVVTAEAPEKEIGIVANGVRDGDEAALAFRQLDVAASRYLGRPLRYYGFVPEDPAVRDAVAAQCATVDQYPHAPASRCFRILAARIAGLGPVQGLGPCVATAPVIDEVPRCA